MTPTTATPQTNDNTPLTGDDAIHVKLKRLTERVTSRESLYRQALQQIALHFDSPYSAFSIDTSSGSLNEQNAAEESTIAQWSGLASGLLLDSRYRGIAIAPLYESAQLKARFAVLTVPIFEYGSSPVGAMAVAVQVDNKQIAKHLLAELSAIVGLLGVLGSQSRSSRQHANSKRGDEVHGAAKAANYETLQEFAFAMANGLKTKLNCEQASIGVAKGHKIRVLCMSGLDDLYPRSPGSRLIRQAMEECRDAQEPICYQEASTNSDDAEGTGHFVHKTWHDETGKSSVLSIPFCRNGNCVIVLSLRNRPGNKFQAADAEKIKTLVEPLIPGVVLLQKAGRSFASHAFESSKSLYRTVIRRGSAISQTLLVLLVAMIAWGLLGSRTMVVTVPCKVKAQRKRHIAAPIDGTLKSVHVQPGQRVSAGDILVQFETDELVLNERRLESEFRMAEIEVRRALESRDVGLAAQAQSKLKMVQAELELIRLQIQSATVLATDAGYVLAGDLRDRIGEVIPLGTELLELAEGEEIGLELKVPQFNAAYIRAGQEGILAVQARPDTELPCKIRRDLVSSSIVDGKHVFLCDAMVTSDESWLRPGMTGVAKIDVGVGKVWWVTLRRQIDAVRLWVWGL